MILEHEKVAYQKLAMLGGIVREINPDLSIQVGVQPPASSDLNYKVFDKQVRLLPDFSLFDGTPTNLHEGAAAVRSEFLLYLLRVSNHREQNS
jgi:hypothetical protein